MSEQTTTSTSQQPDDTKILLSVIRLDNHNVFPISVESTETVENLKALIEVAAGIPLHEQVLSHNDNTLENTQTLAHYKISNHDMLQLKRIPPFNPSQPLAGIDIQNITAEELQRHILGYAPLWDYIQKSQPQLLRAALHQDASLLDQYLAPLQRRTPRNFHTNYPPLSDREVLARQRFANNSNDMEAKKVVEEEENRRRIQENMMNAMEHTPEAFGRVVMLYIDCSVNGHDLKAFIDSGAQMTVMSKRIAQKCGIFHLLDTRFSGVARGVGSAKILGRVHLTQMRIGKTFFNVSITVLDQDDMDFLLGLDMLRRHQCSIDLSENCLKIGDEKARFLSEGELPKNALFDGEMPSTPTTPSVVNPFDRAREQQQHQGQQEPSEESVRALVEMGSTREQAIQLLKQTGGNLNLAASILFGS